MLITLVRLVLVLAALATLFLTPLFTEGPGGREILTEGAIIDVVAIAVLVAVAWHSWRSRRV